MFRLPWIAVIIAVGRLPCAMAQPAVVSTVPTQAVYEYQLNYQLPWQRYWGGPGLSIGGTMPTQGAFGYSTLNGIPFPAPLGAGVYVNSPGSPGPLPPGAMPFGPGPMLTPQGSMYPLRAMGGPMGLGVPTVPRMGFAGQGNMPAMGEAPNPRPRQRQRQAAAPASSPGARRASVEQQKLGDETLRQQLWTKAYVHYRNAADLAPERAEAHFRLGLAFASLKQFASAIRAFKRSLDLDPTLPQSGETLPTIFGADNKLVQTLILPTVADWTREDLRDNDRLFLLGLLLHFDEDPRGSEILEAALRTGGADEHILAFVSPANPTHENRRSGPRPRREPHPQRDPAEEAPPIDLPPSPAPSRQPLSPTPDPPTP